MEIIEKNKSEIREYILEYLSKTNHHILTKNKNSILSIYDNTPNALIENVYKRYRHIKRIQTVHSYNKSVKYDLDNVPLFRAIEIETLNRCNGKCSFCPVNVYSDPRPYAKMNFELYKKIIDELHDLKYAGVISPYSNNEPYLDERMPMLLKYTKESLPKAKLFLFTNCSVLSLDKFKQSIDYLDYLVIDNYNTNKTELNKNPKIIFEYCTKERPELLSKIDFSMRLSDEILSNRGGQAPNKAYSEIQKFERVKCHYPFGQLIIRPDGKISLCCNDALGKYTLGDVNTDKLIDIWYSDTYMKIRTEMMNNGRKNLPLCKDCDTMNQIYTIK